MKQWAMEGGSNEFVDGFKVANDLRKNHPKEFELLSTIPVYFWDIGVDEFVGEFNKIRQSPTLK